MQEYIVCSSFLPEFWCNHSSSPLLLLVNNVLVRNTRQNAEISPNFFYVFTYRSGVELGILKSWGASAKIWGKVPQRESFTRNEGKPYKFIKKVIFTPERPPPLSPLFAHQQIYLLCIALTLLFKGRYCYMAHKKNHKKECHRLLLSCFQNKIG